MSSRPEVTDAILAAAAQLFQAQGYARTSMQDIADAVGMSRPAVYYHFKNKDELLARLVEDVTVRTQREAARIAATAGNGDHAATLRTMTRAHALWILRHPQHFAVVQRDEASLPEHLRAIQDAAKRDLLNSFRQVVASGVAAGQFRQVEPTVAALCIFGMCSSTVQWFKADGRLSQEQVADVIADLGTSMVTRPASPGDGADPLAWLQLLRDDLDHLGESLKGKPAKTLKLSA